MVALSVGMAGRRSRVEAQVARCAGLYVHKGEIVACVRLTEVPGWPVDLRLHTFGATARVGTGSTTLGS